MPGWVIMAVNTKGRECVEALFPQAHIAWRALQRSEASWLVCATYGDWAHRPGTSGQAPPGETIFLFAANFYPHRGRRSSAGRQMNHCCAAKLPLRRNGLSYPDMSFCCTRPIPRCPATNRMSTHDEGRQQLSPREILPNTMKSICADPVFATAIRRRKAGARRAEALPVEIGQHTAGRDSSNVEVQQNL